MSKAALPLLLMLVTACAPGVDPPTVEEPAGHPVPQQWARTFTITERNGYRVVVLRASVVDWGGAARGPQQHARLVLVPAGVQPPSLSGDLRGATLIQVPVKRIAVNAGSHEAMLTALGVDDRLVAVGGTFSYNDSIRARVLSRQVRQVGYGWHSPPELDVLLTTRPEVFLMALGDLDHVDHLERIRELGIAVVPTFVDAETHYLGRVEYLRLVGMLVGREAEAERYIAEVAANVEALKARVAARPPRPMLYAWYGGGDRWMATVRNAEARLIRDAGGVNPLERRDDPERDTTMWVGTETLLTRAAQAQCWVYADDHSVPFTDERTLQRFVAWRQGCMAAANGRMKPDVNAYDLYETAVIRPDLILADLVEMLHPELLEHTPQYILPTKREPVP